MKFFDVLKISLHNMWFNKLRTLLVTTVLLVLSILVTMILAFSINMTSVTNVMVSNNEPLDLSMEYRSMGSTYTSKIDEASVEKMETYFDQNRDKFCSLYYTLDYSYNIMAESSYLQQGNVVFLREDTNFLQGEENPLIAGRLWSKEDEGKPYVWISKNYAINGNYQVGDTMGIAISSEAKSYTNTFTIMGIFYQKSAEDAMGYYGPSMDVVLDSKIIKDNNFAVSRVEMKGPRNVELDIFQLFEISNYAKENTVANYRTGTSGVEVASYKAMDSQMALYISIGVIGGSIFLALIVILLSIGCVSNSIEITVAQNRKFFGVMKAVGLRNKTVKQIVRWQAVIMILLAVLLATGVGVGILFAVKPILANALSIPVTDFSFSMPVYVPFIVFFMQLILVLIFTRKSLNRISKMDVVSVISEVN